MESRKWTACTEKFFNENVLGYEDLMQEGFYDCGRGFMTLAPLSSLRGVPLDHPRYASRDLLCRVAPFESTDSDDFFNDTDFD
eukprot:gene6725-1202_t